jgi:NTE family protein
MSYLLFASKYTRALIEIGYDDASQRIDEIESFLYSSADVTENPPASTVGTSKSREAGSLANMASNSVRSRG